MEAISALAERMSSLLEEKHNDDQTLKETVNECFDFVKEKLGLKGRSPPVKPLKRRQPVLTGFDVREKMASSPYYKGKTLLLGGSQPGSKQERKEARTVTIQYIKRKYGLEV